MRSMRETYMQCATTRIEFMPYRKRYGDRQVSTHSYTQPLKCTLAHTHARERTSSVITSVANDRRADEKRRTNGTATSGKQKIFPSFPRFSIRTYLSVHVHSTAEHKRDGTYTTHTALYSKIECSAHMCVEKRRRRRSGRR